MTQADPLILDYSAGGKTFHDRFSRFRSGLMYALCAAAAVLILILLGLVIGYLVSVGIRSLSLDFFIHNPQADPDAPDYPGGVRHAILGSIILVGMASAVGIPLGMLTGVYLSEYDVGSWLAAPVRFISDVLAGVPSIVVGMVGYELLVVPLGGKNAWAGAAALAFIMVPIVSRTTEEMLRLVPNSYREASIALGASKARTILSVVLPTATGSVVTGVMLAIARVAGETAPLLFTAGGAQSLGGLNEPFPSLTYTIYMLAQRPEPELRKMAWAGAIVLIGLIFVLNLTIRFATSRRR